MASWKWIMRCLVTSTSLWQAVPSKPRPEHTYPSSHHYTSVWWPTFWVLRNTAQKEIAMSSRRYPDVMLCGSTNLPQLLWNPEWPLSRNTKKISDLCIATCLSAATFRRFHSKTPGSLNAAGLQDFQPFAPAISVNVWRIQTSFPPRPANRITTMRCKSKRLAFGRIGLHQFPFGWTLLCWCNKLKYTKKELWGTLNLIARLFKPRFYLSGQLLSSHSEIKKHWHFCWQFGACIGPKTKPSGSWNFGWSRDSGHLRLWKFQPPEKSMQTISWLLEMTKHYVFLNSIFLINVDTYFFVVPFYGVFFCVENCMFNEINHSTSSIRQVLHPLES